MTYEEQRDQLKIELYIEKKATCAGCGFQYRSVKDFLDRRVQVYDWKEPANGKTWPEFVCAPCLERYKEEHERSWT